MLPGLPAFNEGCTMVIKSYRGCVRCPSCAAVGYGQAAIDRHVLHKKDDEHLKYHALAAKRLRGVENGKA